ncbi:MAG: aminopeptidase P family protein, partial [Chloroflexi bacterium]|nr:aminopeptidase P family protein [Chloroflexota bacterium]
MGRYAHGPFNVTYEQRIDTAVLRQKRVERAFAQLDATGLDALLVWKDENVRYLTDLRPQIIAGKSTVLNGALLVPGKAPILLCSGGEIDRVRQTMPWVAEAHTIPIVEERSLIEGLVRDILGPVLHEHGLTHGRIGLDEAPMIFYRALTQHFPELQVEDGDTPMQLARRIKMDEEVALLEEATALADAVTASATAAVAEGVRECEVAAEGMRTLFRLGGEYAHLLTPFVASGEHMAPPHRISSDKLIRNGDLVFIDIGACWNGYFGDVARCVVCGTPSQRQREIYTSVYEALQAGIAAMQPGHTNIEAASAFRKAAT